MFKFNKYLQNSSVRKLFFSGQNAFMKIWTRKVIHFVNENNRLGKGFISNFIKVDNKKSLLSYPVSKYNFRSDNNALKRIIKFAAFKLWSPPLKLLVRLFPGLMNKQDAGGNTLMMYLLCRKRSVEYMKVVKSLLEVKSCDLSIKNTEGYTVADFLLTYILMSGHYSPEVRVFFKEFSELKSFDANYTNTGVTFLELACISKYDRDILLYLLDEKGADVDRYNECFFQKSPAPAALHTAVYFQNIDALNVLAKRNPDWNFKNKDGDNALMSACSLGHWEIANRVYFLGKDSMDLNYRNRNAVIHYCIVNEKQGFLAKRLILDEKVDINIQGIFGCSPLDLASYYLKLDVIKCLRTCGKPVDINARNSFSKTPLHSAITGMLLKDLALSRGEEVVKELLKFPGIDINVKDNHGQTPIEYAGSRRLDNIVKLLEADEAKR